MRLAVISDIHSNAFALEAVLAEIARAGVDETWLVGDTFGYYPWASRTFAAVTSVAALSVLGNHDRWVVRPREAPDGPAGAIARHNSAQLQEEAPAALGWLETLPLARQLTCAGWGITITHGTPGDPLEGRYYPDDDELHGWLPAAGHILILGQTHYPIVRTTPGGGLVVNPGSVGQPRDGNPMPSWALLDLASGHADLRRTHYDHFSVMDRLRSAGWDHRITMALDKRRGS